jgi:hypothetical protein
MSTFIKSVSISLKKKDFIVSSTWFKKLGKVLLCKRKPKNKYKIIKQGLERDAQWPYVGKVIFEK